MKKILSYLLALVGLFIFNSCKKAKTTEEVNTEVQIRVQNSTAFTFSNCTVDPVGTLSDNPSINAYNYEQVNIGLTTDYHTFPKAYRYSWFRLAMNSKTYYLKPYDYTGETPLVHGHYTYKITHSTISDNLNLELIKD